MTKQNNLIHGMSYTVYYRTWSNIKSRCLNKNTKFYKDYGGRGIKICDRWLNSFENFYEDMGERPSNKHSLDRIDNDGDYCKENCRWATWIQQSRNSRNTRMITYKGETYCLTKWAEMLDIKYSALIYRLNKGWNVEDVFNKPTRKLKQDK